MEVQGGQVLQQLMTVRLIKDTAVVLIGELAGEIGIAGDRQGGVVAAETTIIKIRGDGVIEPPELLRASSVFPLSGAPDWRHIPYRSSPGSIHRRAVPVH